MAQHVAAADLTYSVLLCAQARVMDGIVKAHGAGKRRLRRAVLWRCRRLIW
jgi:hypothetical protein